MTNDKRTITVNELAEWLGISRPTAYGLVRQDGFPAIRVSERRIVIPVDKLEEWIDREATKHSI